MRVLMRRPGESITIGDDTLVKIISAHDQRVRIGVHAPRDRAIRAGEDSPDPLPERACEQCAAEDGGSWVRADEIKRLVRELDIALNGAAGAARQATLGDLVAQVREMRLARNG